MPTISSFRSTENKHDIYRGKDCMKKSCEYLREHEVKVINFKKKKMKLLTKEQQESYENAQVCYMCKEKFENKYLKDQNIVKLEIIVIRSLSYILQFLDSTRFMASSLSNLVNNLSGRLHRIKCKLGHDDKKCDTCGIKYKYCDCFLEYTNFKDDLIEYKCSCCNKSYQRKFDEKLKERFFKIYKFSNHDNKKFILLLRKSFNPYEHIMIEKNSVKHHYMKIFIVT